MSAHEELLFPPTAVFTQISMLPELQLDTSRGSIGSRLRGDIFRRARAGTPSARLALNAHL